MVTAKQVKSVMEKYGKAWENRDVNLILGCFTRDGIYQENPLSKPYRGRSEIAKFWEKVVGAQENVRFRLGRCYVSDDKGTGFAEWECSTTHSGKRERMVGIMILKLSGGKITSLNEYWNTKPTNHL